MAKRFRDANGISHYASDGSVVPISKFARGYPKPNGRVFGGKVIAQEVPTKWIRAGISKKYGGRLSRPEHEDLINIDMGSPPKITDPRAGQFEDIFHSPLLVRVD